MKDFYDAVMRVRLKDVAEHAGVSVKTVSNVVNNYTYVSASTRQRVQASIDMLGYRPNLAARQLKHGRGGFLTLAVPEMDSPYFAHLSALMAAEATRRGYLFLMDATGASAAQERLVLSGMRAHMVDGVIFSPLAVSRAEIEARTDDIPLVLLGEREVPTQFDHVAVDSVAASAAVAEHLLELGRTRLAVIGVENGEGTGAMRSRGFCEAVARAGFLVPEKRRGRVGNFTREEGRAAMQTLLALPEEERPDGVFAFNDLLAIGALRACQEAGVRVPDDIAIVGFDDIPEAAFHTPSLTSISPDYEMLTTAVLDLLIARIEGGEEPPQDVSVPWTLIVRESSDPGERALRTPGSRSGTTGSGSHPGRGAPTRGRS